MFRSISEDLFWDNFKKIFKKEHIGSKILYKTRLNCGKNLIHKHKENVHALTQSDRNE